VNWLKSIVRLVLEKSGNSAGCSALIKPKSSLTTAAFSLNVGAVALPNKFWGTVK
jgi:hypothetical protein